MKKFTFFICVLSICSFLFIPQGHSRPSKNKTVGILAMGNIQLVDATAEVDPGYGGGLYFDYRFNQRFSITTDIWVTTHSGTGRSSGDNGIEILGIPTFTIKMYFVDDESSKWDPYAGIGIGAYAVSEGSRKDGTNGVGLGAQIDLGFDYHLSDYFSVGFSGVFRSAAIITGFSGANNGFALLPFSLTGKVGYHF